MRSTWQFFLMRMRLAARDKWLLFFTFGAPLIFSAALGIAFRDGGSDARVLAPAELQKTLSAKGLEAKDAPTENLALVQVQRGQADALVIPGTPPQIFYSTGRAESKLAAFEAREALSPASVEGPQLKAVPDTSGRYIDFLIPGLLGYSMFTSALFNLGGNFAIMRRTKLLRRLHPTPMPRVSMMMGFMLGQLAQAAVEIVALLLMGYVMFGVRCHGSLPLFVAFSLLSALGFSGIGVLIASRASSPEVSNGIGNILMYPVILASGVFFSAERFPEAAQPWLKLIPTRAALDGMRLVFNDGAGVSALLAPGLVVVVWGVVSLAVGIRLFRWH